MFRKTLRAASSAADAHTFSSLASPFTSPPKPTPLNSRNSTSCFTIPAETIGVSTARLQKFLQTNGKSGDVSADEAFCFFHFMVQMEPRFRLYSFNLLLIGLAKNKRYSDVVSLYGKMNSAGLTPNFVTLNILLNCSCHANRLRDAFLVMGRILRKGYSPTIVTLNSLMEGLFIGSRAAHAVQLFLRLEKFGYHPDVISRSILIHGLCSLENANDAFKLHEESVSGNGQEGKEDKAIELFSDIDAPRLFCDTLAYREGNNVKGQEELKPNIHSKEKASTCLAWETPHDPI